jgi:hypothetical protein
VTRTCCEYHRHIDASEPFAAGVDVTWCGAEYVLNADDQRAWESLGLDASRIVRLPSPPEPPCPECGMPYCECEEQP